jgi:hypothetical protein
MDDQPCRSFFLEPRAPPHRRYEALRAYFIEGRPPAEIAARYGYKPAAFNVMVSRFRGQVRRDTGPPFFSPMGAGGPRGDRAARTATARGRPKSPISGPST